MSNVETLSPLPPSDTDANEARQDVLGHDQRVAGLANVFTVHIPDHTEVGE